MKLHDVPQGIDITVTRASSNSSTISEGDNVLHEGETKKFKVVLVAMEDLLNDLPIQLQVAVKCYF
jgi:hypothetical protein